MNLVMSKLVNGILELIIVSFIPCFPSFFGSAFQLV